MNLEQVLYLLPSQVPGVSWCVLGLVDPVSVYRDWVTVQYETSVCVRQHLQPSERISPCSLSAARTLSNQQTVILF